MEGGREGRREGGREGRREEGGKGWDGVSRVYANLTCNTLPSVEVDTSASEWASSPRALSLRIQLSCHTGPQ